MASQSFPDIPSPAHVGLRIVSNSSKMLKHKNEELMRLKGQVFKLEQEESKALNKANEARKNLKKRAAMMKEKHDTQQYLRQQNQQREQALADKAEKVKKIHKKVLEAGKVAESKVSRFVREHEM